MICQKAWFPLDSCKLWHDFIPFSPKQMLPWAARCHETSFFELQGCLFFLGYLSVLFLQKAQKEGVVEQKYFTFPLSVSFVIFLYISIRQINVLSYESKCHPMKALEEWPLKESYFSLYEFYCQSSIIMVTKGARMVILIEYCLQYPCFS